jgi:hypothetical protein
MDVGLAACALFSHVGLPLLTALGANKLQQMLHRLAGRDGPLTKRALRNVLQEYLPGAKTTINATADRVVDTYRKDEYPLKYAMAQSNLGNALTDLPAADADERAQNVRRAIDCYEEALAFRALLPDQGPWAEAALARARDELDGLTGSSG